MTIREGEAARSVMIAGGQINPFGGVGRKESGIVDAIRMFVHEDPGVRRSGDPQVGGFLHMEKGTVHGTTLCVALAHNNVPRDTAHTLRPTSVALRAADVSVRRAFEQITGITEVDGQLRVTPV